MFLNISDVIEDPENSKEPASKDISIPSGASGDCTICGQVFFFHFIILLFRYCLNGRADEKADRREG